MAIKYLIPKSYGEVLQRLINGYKKVKDTNPQGLDLIKIKLEAMEQIRESKKIIKLPEEKITDYTKDRPIEGPKAEVEKFPKEKIVRKQSDLKVKPAEDMIKEDDFDPSGMASGGLAYLLGEEPVKMAGGGAIKKALEKALKKLGNKVTTADKIKRPESALRKEMFDEFNKRNKKIDKKRRLTNDEIADYEEELGDSETWMSEGTVEEAEEALKDRKAEIAYMYAQYKMGKLDPVAGEKTRDRMQFLKKREEEAESIKDFRLFGEDEIDELDELEKRFEYLDLEDKAQNISRKMTGEEIQKLKEINDSGYVDFQKEIDRINKNKKAYGGRIGFFAGGINKARRGFLKLLGVGAGAAVTANTGLFGLMKGGKKTADVAKVATKVAGVAPNQPPRYLFDLVKVIREKGKDITKSAQTIERETVKTYKGVDLYENPDGFRIKAEVGPYEDGKKIELMYSKTEEVKDLGLETQKSFDVIDYEEVTVRPDPDGKMKDVDFYVDENDHDKLKKIVEDETSEKGGLGYLIGEK